MSYRRRRTDRNHGDVVDALERCGWRVFDLSAVGGGCADLLVFRAGELKLVEVKTPEALKGRSGNPETRKKQERFRAHFPVVVVSDVEQVAKL